MSRYSQHRLIIYFFIMKDLQWFKDHVGFTVLRGTTQVEIRSDAMAEELFKLQSDTYQFREQLRVHRKPPEERESCSA